jgi:hypothetical protein
VLLTLGLPHQLVDSIGESRRFYMNCIGSRYFDDKIYWLFHYKVVIQQNSSYIVKYFIYISLGSRLPSTI